MNDITTLIINTALSILTILAGLAFKQVKTYLTAKGGEKAVLIAEIVAKNAVNAVEQIVAVDNDNHVDKYDMAKRRVISELSKYNITLSESQLETFIESAVKQMNDSWKGEVHDTSK